VSFFSGNNGYRAVATIALLHYGKGVGPGVKMKLATLEGKIMLSVHFFCADNDKKTKLPY
jgi:hypothetical protein